MPDSQPLDTRREEKYLQRMFILKIKALSQQGMPRKDNRVPSIAVVNAACAKTKGLHVSMMSPLSHSRHEEYIIHPVQSTFTPQAAEKLSSLVTRIDQHKLHSHTMLISNSKSALILGLFTVLASRASAKLTVATDNYPKVRFAPLTKKLPKPGEIKDKRFELSPLKDKDASRNFVVIGPDKDKKPNMMIVRINLNLARFT